VRATPLAVDPLVAGYSLLLAIIWAALTARAAYAPWMCAAHLAGASLFLVLRRRPHLGRATACLREYYPLLWTLGFWLELDYLLPLLHPVYFDTVVEGLDRALLGASWARQWSARASSPWLSEPMHLLYMLFPLVTVPPLWFGVTGRRAALREIVLGLTLCYVCCCLAYLLMPVEGPRASVAAGAPSANGLFHRLAVGYARLGDRVGDPRGSAFPSFHVAGAVVTAWVAWRWWPRAVAVPVTVVAVGLSISTVYTQNHYVLDAAAGAALALVVQGLVAPALRPHARSR
jgi:hypothetical protein